MDNPLTLTRTEVSTRSFITKVYGWMSLGLALTGWIAAMIGTNEAFLGLLLANRPFGLARELEEIGRRNQIRWRGRRAARRARNLEKAAE